MIFRWDSWEIDVREQGTGNRGQGIGNRGQGIGNREQGRGFGQLYFSLLMSVFFRSPTYLHLPRWLKFRE